MEEPSSDMTVDPIRKQASQPEIPEKGPKMQHRASLPVKKRDPPSAPRERKSITSGDKRGMGLKLAFSRASSKEFDAFCEPLPIGSHDHLTSR